jgi:hypothetical protein
MAMNEELDAAIKKGKAAMDRSIAQFQIDANVAKKTADEGTAKVPTEEGKLVRPIEKRTVKVGRRSLDKA